jgi:glutathione S-transferase
MRYVVLLTQELPESIEIGIPYELKTIPYNSEYFESDEFLAINPMGKIPALYDGEQLIVESTVIMQYVLDRYGPSELAVPVHDAEYAKFLTWLHMAESGILHYTVTGLGNMSDIPKYQISDEHQEYCFHQVSKAYNMLEEAIGDKDYILSKGFTAADISTMYTLFLHRNVGQQQLPDALEAYYQRCASRPVYEKVLGGTAQF